jgi:hypothetical protein
MAKPVEHDRILHLFAYSPCLVILLPIRARKLERLPKEISRQDSSLARRTMTRHKCRAPERGLQLASARFNVPIGNDFWHPQNAWAEFAN